MHSEIPEVRLLSAVIALAINDLAKPPIKLIKGFRPQDETLSACNFIFTGVIDSYLHAIDANPEQFRRKLLQMVDNRKDDKVAGFDQGQRRMMKLNINYWKENYERLGRSVFEDESEFADDAQFAAKTRH